MPLWNHLDTCGLGFRQTKQQLINRNGFRESGWNDGLEYCEPKVARPFISNLAHPLVFHLLALSDLKMPPDTFFGFIRKTDDAQENFDLAHVSLCALFGEGANASASNTVSHKWQVGFANVTATIFPPKKNTQFPKNHRHDLVSGSNTECSLTIEPAWRAPLLRRELNWVKSFKRLFTSVAGDGNPLRLVQSFSVDWPVTVKPQASGFGISACGEAVLHIVDPALVNIIPRLWIKSVILIHLLPARGPGQAAIWLDYYPGGQDHLPKIHAIAEREGDPKALDEYGQKLAEKLGVECNIHEQLNV